MDPDLSGIERWLESVEKDKAAKNREVMERYGMERRSRILFASLNVELIANVLRNIEIGRTDKDGLQKKSFNDNIDFLFHRHMMTKEVEEQFHAFRHIRNNFVHEIECKDSDDLVKLKPDLKPLMLRLADEVLKAVPLPLNRTEKQRLDLGMNIITNRVIAECGRMVEEQAKRRGA